MYMYHVSPEQTDIAAVQNTPKHNLEGRGEENEGIYHPFKT